MSRIVQYSLVFIELAMKYCDTNGRGDLINRPRSKAVRPLYQSGPTISITTFHCRSNSIGVYILCDYTKYSLVLDALAPAPARAHARGRVVNIPEGGAA